MLNNFLQTKVGTTFSGLLPFDLQDLKGFPYQRYVEEQEAYTVLLDWYNSTPLRESTTDSESGKKVEKFPIKINPLKGTAQKHAAIVFGQNVGSIRFAGLPFQLIPDVDLEDETSRETAKQQKMRIIKALNKTFERSALGAQFLSATLLSQILGGQVYRAGWLPKQNRVDISSVKPNEFVGIPRGTDYWNLREGWVVREIDEFTARSYAYEPKGNENKFWYIEHWTENEYEIMINGNTLKFDSGQPQKGRHGWGMVPMVYIPHIRITGFLGEGIITETVRGLIKELNLRWADVGDAVNDDSHSYVAVRQIRGTVQTINVGDGRPILDLGSSSGMANDPQPDMFSVATKSISEPMLKLGGELYKIYRRETNHPAVADGEDEGSQRSALTLATRMAPLVSEAEMERLFLTVGFTHLAKIVLTIMTDKKLNEITKEDIEIPLITQWQSMLPKDREALVQEAAVRSKNKLGSQKHIMGLFGDINNPDEEQAIIDEEVEELMKNSPQVLAAKERSKGSGSTEKPAPTSTSAVVNGQGT